MRESLRSWMIYCLVALAGTVMAVLLRTAVADLSQQRVPVFLWLIVAVFATAAFGGYKAGLMTTAFCILLGTRMFSAQSDQENLNPTNRMRILVFLVEGLAISCGFEAMRHKRTQLEEEVKDRKHIEDELVLAAQRKNHFLANLAHELRNPLAPVRQSLEIMRQTANDPARLELLRGMIERNVNYMTRLVDDLLDAARLSHNKIALRKEHVAVTDIIEQALEISRPLIEAARHEVTTCAPSQPIYLEADPVRLIQVVSNLLNNAAKYMDPGGHIWLTVRCLEDAVQISVRDAGVGIPHDMLAQVFDMFAQVEQNPRRSQGGLGIGLAVVKTVVEMHGGSVEAHSEGLGKGSEFIVRLPQR
jgi:signal transduction histidine kinase